MIYYSSFKTAGYKIKNFLKKWAIMVVLKPSL